ncbi:hypothetical protein, partial [Asanoa sp. NPDC050611]|uniref:hypothetical protein n=1 Tax=Asanoa sp. NPDC050611 TaxID=3157098 RepID=UPI0033D2EB0C
PSEGAAGRGSVTDRTAPSEWDRSGTPDAGQADSPWSRAAVAGSTDPDRDHNPSHKAAVAAGWDGSAAVADQDEGSDGLVGVKLKEGERSSLRPSTPTGTPTYEGTGIEDTAVLPKIGQAMQTQRIWTTRPEPPEDEEERADHEDEKAKKNKKIDVTSLLDVGMKLLPELDPDVPDGPVTNARWAALVRSGARRMIWTLPAAGVVAAAASLGAIVGGGPAHYLSGESPFRLIAWVTSVWLAMVAMIALVGVLSAVRSRAAAVFGLMLGIFGGVSMLMFAAVPPATPIWGLSAKTLALTCAGIYSAGWMAMGWAVFRSRMFARGDGLMLICSGPMVGIAGLWMSPFHTTGALLLFAAGLGIAWKSGSTLRAVRAGRAPAPADPRLDLAEIRPRRARREQQPGKPKPAKPPKRGKQSEQKSTDRKPAPGPHTRPPVATGRAEVTKPPTPSNNKPTQPAKDEKPAPSRRPGKRRLRLGAKTRESAPPDDDGAQRGGYADPVLDLVADRA